MDDFADTQIFARKRASSIRRLRFNSQLHERVYNEIINHSKPQSVRVGNHWREKRGANPFSIGVTYERYSAPFYLRFSIAFSATARSICTTIKETDNWSETTPFPVPLRPLRCPAFDQKRVNRRWKIRGHIDLNNRIRECTFIRTIYRIWSIQSVPSALFPNTSVPPRSQSLSSSRTANIIFPAPAQDRYIPPPHQGNHTSNFAPLQCSQTINLTLSPTLGGYLPPPPPTPFLRFAPRCLFRATAVLASSVRSRNYPPSEAARANVTKCKFYIKYVKRRFIEWEYHLIRDRDKLPDYFTRIRTRSNLRRDGWRALVCRNCVRGDAIIRCNASRWQNVIPYNRITAWNMHFAGFNKRKLRNKK